jgi:uncharacterized membrane protein YeaQ/YmgE (transglycosylase-associated protein family)
VLGAIVSIIVSGLIVGGLARLAVPGPDPMPIWLTIGIGVVGSIIGGTVAGVIAGADAVFAIFVASVIAGTLLVIAYRRFVQGRGVTGPDARLRPRDR